MIVVTFLFVTDLIRSMTAGPKPGNLVSTRTTPASVMKTAMLPPLNASWFEAEAFDPVMMYRLSFTFSIFTAASAAADGPDAGAWNAEIAMETDPMATNAASAKPRLIS